MTSTRDLRLLPKAHLHVHIEAAMRKKTLVALAAKHRVTLPAFRARDPWGRLSQYYRAASSVLRTTDDIDLLIHQFVEDNYSDGVVWVEPQLYPLIHTQLFGDAAVAIEYFSSRLQAACRHFSISGGLMVTADRRRDTSEALELAKHASGMRGAGVVSFGLANREEGHLASQFESAFSVAREAGLVVAPHAGETDGPEAIRNAIVSAKPDRLQHGVRSVEDPSLLELLVSRQIVLDVCLYSNIALGVSDDIRQHQIRDLLEADVRVSLGADNPLAFGHNILGEYEFARHGADLDDDRLARIARVSIEASGLPSPLKETYLQRIMSWLNSPDN